MKVVMNVLSVVTEFLLFRESNPPTPGNSSYAKKRAKKKEDKLSNVFPFEPFLRNVLSQLKT